MEPERKSLFTSATAPASQPRALLSAGSSLKHYEIIRKLGQGGMGAVFLARDTKLGRLVAIKVLIEPRGASAGRFLIEARATARCKHENIVVIHEVDEIDGHPYMVLEHLEGRTLREWVTRRELESPSEPLPPSLAVELIVPVVRALGCAHQHGIVHRDLKPENIFLTDAGRVVVLDFGIAKQLGAPQISRVAGAEDGTMNAPELTQDGVLLGTLPYISPEQWRSEEIDARGDLWAVGIILYELCTGGYPLELAPIQKLASVANLNLAMPSVRDKRPDIGALGAVIDRCLKKRSSERFGSAEELCAALEPLLPGEKGIALGLDEGPFAGLSSFQEADAARFFGREREVSAVVGRLRNQPLVAVAGPSGAGKSSLVRAGVGLAERARRRRRQIAAAVIAALAATAIIVSFLAIRANREAARADREASLVLAEARQGRNATRIAVAREHLQSDPTTALALLREVEPPGVPRGWAELVSLVREGGLARVMRFRDVVVYSADYSPDGARLAVALNDGTAEVWNADGTGPPIVLRGHTSWVWSAAWSPDGKRIVTASEDRTARVWTDVEPLRGADDPRLWTVTSDCLSTERRIDLLGVSEATARAEQEACERRVAEENR